MTGVERRNRLFAFPLLIAGCVGAAILSAVSIGVAPPLLHWPRYSLMLAFHVLGRSGPGTEILSLACIGLLQDVLLGGVIGAGALGLLAGHALFRRWISSLRRSRTPGRFLLFVPFLIVTLTIEWGLTSLARMTVLPTEWLIWQITLTSAVYLAVMGAWAALRHWRGGGESAKLRIPQRGSKR